MQEFRCPYCNSVITSKLYSEVLNKMKKETEESFKKARIKLETELREHYEKHFTKQRKEIEDARKLLSNTKKRLEEEKRDLAKKERVMKKSLEAETKLKFERQFQEQQNLVKKKLDELEEMKSNLKRQELELRSSIKKELELKYENELDKEREKLDKERKRLEDKEYELKMQNQEIISAYQKRQINLQRTIERQNTVIEELKREADRRSLAELGDIPEERLEDILRKEFPEDIPERFGKGRAGGDIIQTIIFNGNPIGKILYESKNERNWKNAWIEKIKTDRGSVPTTYAILVSKAFPRNEKHFAIIKGIPVVSPRLLPHMARIIRASIIAIERQKLSAFEKEEKVSILLTYLNSNEFKSSATVIGESIENLNKIRQDERNKHIKHWEEETNEVNKISDHFTKIVSKLDTIIESKETPLIVKKKRNLELQ